MGNDSKQPLAKRAGLPQTGKGMLFIDARVWQDLGEPMSASEWVQALQLPAKDYQIVHIRRHIHSKNGVYGRFEMVVSHANLPREIEIGRLEVRPLYTRDANRKTILDRVDFWHWDGQKHHLLMSDTLGKGGE